jgi:hypothetical protein
VRSIVPDRPLGAHRVPAAADADLSPEAVAESVLALLAALDLHDVTLVRSLRTRWCHLRQRPWLVTR